jgi:hypothetical protein
MQMTRADKQKIASWRGWGPTLVENIIREVKNVLSKEEKVVPPRQRTDDMPLEGEGQSDN